jgi:hypothetical protein
VAALAPDVFAQYGHMEWELDVALPPDALQLCRARMAMLLGAPVPDAPAAAERWAELSGWPTSPLFGDRDRACLALAEQFVIDVTAIQRSDVDRLLAHFTPQQTLAFVSALWFHEAMLRLGLVLGAARAGSEA